MENEITATELSQSLKQSANEVFLIDLMSKEDFEGVHIPGAINIPVEELGDHLSEIPKDKKVVVVCRRGLMKSDLALEELRNSGFTNAKKLSGGTTGWFDSFPGSSS